MQIKDLPSSTSLATTDVLVKETSAGTTQKITGENLIKSFNILGPVSLSMSGATGYYAMSGSLVYMFIDLITATLSKNVEAYCGALPITSRHIINYNIVSNGREWNIRVSQNALYVTYKGGDALPSSGSPGLAYMLLYFKA